MINVEKYIDYFFPTFFISKEVVLQTNVNYI